MPTHTPRGLYEVEPPCQMTLGWAEQGEWGGEKRKKSRDGSFLDQSCEWNNS